MDQAFNLLYLKYFLDAAEKGSVSESAKMNFVTQSAVSQGIQKLERAFGVNLKKELKNKFRLTDEGKIVFDKARIVFRSLNEIQEELNFHSNIIKKEVVFASTQSLAHAFFPQTIQKLEKKYPQVKLHFRIGNMEQIRHWLKREEVEFAIVLDSNGFEQYDKHLIKTGRFHVYQHRAIKTPLEHGVYIDSEHGIAVNELKNAFPKLYVSGELNSWELVAHFVETKAGLGLLPDFIQNNGLHPEIVPLQKNKSILNYDISAIFQKNEKPSKALSAILECLIHSH